MAEEVWKNIDFDNIPKGYQVSNHGNVKEVISKINKKLFTRG